MNSSVIRAWSPVAGRRQSVSCPSSTTVWVENRTRSGEGTNTSRNQSANAAASPGSTSVTRTQSRPSTLAKPAYARPSPSDAAKDSRGLRPSLIDDRTSEKEALSASPKVARSRFQLPGALAGA
ncbi:hypothetical protein L1885_24245 [Streptomyces fuscigenes]|nr:hypothetical protein [Streptomyces fuscigenes]